METAVRPEPSGQGIHHQSRRDLVIVIMLVAVLAGLFTLYGPLNQGPERWVLKTWLDERIPLVEPFVVPYLSIFVVAAVTLPAFLLKSARIARSALLAAVLTLIVAYLFYAFAQTHVPRPSVTGDDVFSAMLRFVYGGDNAYNCFPSLHTAFSVLMGIHWMWFRLRIGRYVAAWCGLIVLSTIFVHQHYVADVAGGVVVAVSACLAARRLTGGPVPLRRNGEHAGP
ncbi:phosphatase PAP2 family protein [Actinomadura sp. HBU206391]|uniref:phosphatase PAP2 family protein n=1 Tax=Actinomadura sp. HBU206391 TaxID=2731692 RepID=UPI0016504161|nr:phosphatase PAP2 family protein [Actinomadura sp. HBU206391]MBC6459983.1 phosphatase PAP2 family protein [Actinomadura sp. HBU206391]